MGGELLFLLLHIDKFTFYPILYHIRSGAFRAYYSIYASVRIYMRIHESHQQLPGFAILKRKKKLPMGLYEASSLLPVAWGRHFSCDFKETGVFSEGSGYGYGTVPGGRWTIDTEGGHVVVSVSLIRNGYEYGTVPDLRGAIHTESGHMVNSVS